jgi:hypothetical protein
MTTMTISKDLLDQLLDGVQNADDLLGEHGLMKDLKIRLMERMLGAEGVSETLCMEFSPCGFHGSSVEPFGI